MTSVLDQPGVRAAIAAAVESAPPLSPAQADTIARILAPAATPKPTNP